MADKDIRIRIIVESAEADANLKKVDDTAENTSQSFGKLQASIVTLNQGFDLVSRAFGVASNAGRQLFDALDQARVIDGLSNSFDSFQERLGRDSTDAMDSLKKATGGLVSELELLELGATSAALGVDQGTDQFFELTEAATKASIALGKDFSEAVAVINQGIGRLSPQVLDNLGVTLKLGEVYDKAAAKLGIATTAMSEQQKKAALLEETLRQLQGNFGDVSLTATTAAQAAQKLEAAFADAQKELFQGINSSEDLKAALADLAKLLNSINWKAIGKLIGDVAAALISFGKAAKFAFDQMARGIPQLNAARGAYALWAEMLGIGVEEVEKVGAGAEETSDKVKVLTGTTDDNAGSTDKMADAWGRLVEGFDTAAGLGGIPALNDEMQLLISWLEAGRISTADFNIAMGNLAANSEATGIKYEDFVKSLDVSRATIKNVGEELDKLFEDPELFSFGEGGIKTDGIGKFFDDLFDFEPGSSKTIGGDLLQGIGGAIQQGLDSGFGSDTAGSIVDSISGGLKQTGNPFAVAGGFALDLFGDDIISGVRDIFKGSKKDPFANAREDFQGFLIDAFDAQETAAVINGELVNLADLVDLPRDIFDDGSPFDFLHELPQVAEEAFSGVGIALGNLLGPGGLAGLGQQFGAELATGLSGDTLALKGAVDALGISYEQLGDAVVSGTKKGEQSFLEAQSALNGIQFLAQDGIPGAIGATVQAFDKMKQAGTLGGATTIQALKAIGAEAQELGLETLVDLEQQLLNSGVAAQDVSQFMEALAETGISSVTALADATDRQAIQALADLESQSFAFAETFRDNIDELVGQLDSIPDEIRSRVVVEVETVALDTGGQQLIDNGSLAFGEGIGA